MAVDHLSPFAQAFESLVRERIPERAQIPKLKVEEETDFGVLTREIAPFLPWMAPFGEKNPEPLLATRGALIKSLRTVGNGHLKMRLEHGGIQIDGLLFGSGGFDLQAGQRVDLAYHPFLSEFNGSTRLEIRIRDVKAE